MLNQHNAEITPRGFLKRFFAGFAALKILPDENKCADMPLVMWRLCMFIVSLLTVFWHHEDV